MVNKKERHSKREQKHPPTIPIRRITWRPPLCRKCYVVPNRIRILHDDIRAGRVLVEMVVLTVQNQGDGVVRVQGVDEVVGGDGD
jgi:hypothetical protein